MNTVIEVLHKQGCGNQLLVNNNSLKSVAIITDTMTTVTLSKKWTSKPGEFMKAVYQFYGKPGVYDVYVNGIKIQVNIPIAHSGDKYYYYAIQLIK